MRRAASGWDIRGGQFAKEGDSDRDLYKWSSFIMFSTFGSSLCLIFFFPLSFAEVTHTWADGQMAAWTDGWMDTSGTWPDSRVVTTILYFLN